MPRLFDLRPDERRPAAVAAACHFCVLFAWYLVRPLREALGIQRGPEALGWLMIGTVVVAAAVNPLVGRVVDRRTRADALRLVYRSVQIVLVAAWAGFLATGAEGDVRLGYAFFVASSVLNLLIVSVFWSLCTEAFSVEGARRVFGPAAAGGSLGALCGSSVAALAPGGLSAKLHLLLAAAIVLQGAIFWSRGLLVQAPVEAPDEQPDRAAFRGSAWSAWSDVVRTPFALAILGYMGFHAISGTWAYMAQGEIVARTDDHVTHFAYIDLTTSALTLGIQLFLVGRLVRRVGVGWTLSILPIVSAVGFLLLVQSQTYAALLVFQTLRRATGYGLSKPTREMLFSVFTPEQKYKLKNLLDVAGYRVADLLGSSSRIALARIAQSFGTPAVQGAAAIPSTTLLCGVAAGASVLWLGYNLSVVGPAYSRLVARLGSSGTEAVG